MLYLLFSPVDNDEVVDEFAAGEEIGGGIQHDELAVVNDHFAGVDGVDNDEVVDEFAGGHIIGLCSLILLEKRMNVLIVWLNM
ncbi:hypothetical protein A2U01_0026851, partial [Trifolium medium]|nr:hypothetical protein [Trifolium medium]